MKKKLILIFLVCFILSFALGFYTGLQQYKEQEYISGYKYIAEVTMYTAGYESTGKTPEHPAYGITFSGEEVEKWHTIAASPSIPLYSIVYIPYFKDKPNNGVFIVTDRGGLIRDGGYKYEADICLDIYTPDLQYALEFGRQVLEVYIIKEG